MSSPTVHNCGILSVKSIRWSISLDPEPILLRVSEAARRLSISRATAYQMIADGVIPVATLGSIKRVPAAALHELAAGAWRTGDTPPK